ncbi:hypothetical protein [Chondrinema litorale]|uniref:hypothetical protein n=1 Tax=Chondrinema litorale TaxID=2994555 RepID=UPI002542A8A0|nr:hypothetical protein [Chondrinema litorale]UZR99276.1 hypothetical protein OQ292_35430 [Chondrinema litorale]
MNKKILSISLSLILLSCTSRKYISDPLVYEVYNRIHGDGHRLTKNHFLYKRVSTTHEGILDDKLHKLINSGAISKSDSISFKLDYSNSQDSCWNKKEMRNTRIIGRFAFRYLKRRRTSFSSKPYFNKEKDKALYETLWNIEQISNIYYLEKVNGKWEIKDEFQGL